MYNRNFFRWIKVLEFIRVPATPVWLWGDNCLFSSRVWGHHLWGWINLHMIVLSYKCIIVNSWSIQTQCICPGNCIRFALSCMFLCPNISSFWLSIIMIKGFGPKPLVLLYSVILWMNLLVIATTSFTLIGWGKPISSSLLLIESADKM